MLALARAARPPRDGPETVVVHGFERRGPEPAAKVLSAGPSLHSQGNGCALCAGWGIHKSLEAYDKLRHKCADENLCM